MWNVFPVSNFNSKWLLKMSKMVQGQVGVSYFLNMLVGSQLRGFNRKGAISCLPTDAFTKGQPMFSSQMGGHGRMPLLNTTLGGSILLSRTLQGPKPCNLCATHSCVDTYVHDIFITEFPYDIYENSNMKYSQIPKWDIYSYFYDIFTDSHWAFIHVSCRIPDWYFEFIVIQISMWNPLGCHNFWNHIFLNLI